MADIGDLAQAREEENRSAALATYQNRQKPKGESAVFCSSCGERIPEARRQAVVTDLCVFCAQQFDKGR